MRLRLQQEDLALQISQARGLRSLNILNIFQGQDASQKFFGIRWACVLKGFEIGEGNLKLRSVFGCGQFAAFDPPADSALILADAFGGFNGGSRKSGNWSIVPPHFPTEPSQESAKSGVWCKRMGRMAHNRAQKAKKGG